MKKVRPSDSGSKNIREHIFTRDVFGRTVLHLAVLCDQPDLMSKILRIPEAKSIILATDCESGWNVLHYILYHKRLRCLVVLLEYFDKNYTGNFSTLRELLKMKDRSGTPPVFLLKNDFKDFVWIPTYVNENNEYHLEYRYPEQDASDATTQKTRRSWQLDHIMWNPKRGGSDLYVMGSNANHALGVGDSTDRSVPVKLPYQAFQRPHHDLKSFLSKPRYRDIKISKYHSVALTTEGSLFSCGLGSKGRLGHGNAKDTFKFARIDFFERERKAVTSVAISSGHSLALTSSNDLFAWGSNTYGQLGLVTADLPSSKGGIRKDHESVPSLVSLGELRKSSCSIIGISTSSIHSVAYTKEAVYMWGLNVGQMGFESAGHVSHSCNVNGIVLKGHIIDSPVRTFKERVKILATCETCSCVVTASNELFVFYGYHRYKLPKLPTRSDSENFDAYKPSRLTAPPSIRKIAMTSPEKIYLLLESGDVMSFSVMSGFDMKAAKAVKYSYIWKAYDSNLRAVDIDNAADGSIVLCTRDGSVFTKSSQTSEAKHRSSKNSIVPSIAMTAKNKYSRLEGVNKVVRVACDESFTSFCYIRDDVDVPPFKLQKNNFKLDLAYLSPLGESDSFRKQDQLLDTDHELNCYVVDFLSPSRPQSFDDDDPRSTFFGSMIVEDDFEHGHIEDKLVKLYEERYVYTTKSEITSDRSYQNIDDIEMGRLSAVVSNEPLMRNMLLANSSEKFYDAKIEFANEPNVVLSFHESILAARSNFFRRIAYQGTLGDYFVFEDLKGSYDCKSKVLTFETDIDFRAVVILLHFVYTNRVIDFWEAFPTGSNCPPNVKRTKDHFGRLMTRFQMDPYYGRDNDFVGALQDCWKTEEKGDIVVELRDGEVYCNSSMLVARSAFFETFLSERWDPTNDEDSVEVFLEEAKHIDLKGVTISQFDVILRHIYGCNDLDVFNCTYSQVSMNNESDEFVNYLLDLIEISDELLLLQLKQLCELAIKNLISIENCLLLLTHSFHLSAPKLFKCCCWYIFNNIDLLIFDPGLKDLDAEVLIALEKELRFLQLMKQGDFVIGEHGEVNLNLLRSLNGPVQELDELPELGKPLNDLFLTDDSSFKPIFDHPPASLGSLDDKKRRTSSRRLSRKGSTSELQKEMEALKLSYDARRPSDSAVADDVHHSESDFELVSSRRRQKSRSSVPAQPDTDTEERTLNQITRTKSASPSPPPPAASVGKTVSLDLGSGNSSSSSIALVPLGPSLKESSNLSSRPKTKIKFSAGKRSQKERKRFDPEALLGNGSGSETPPAFANPWKTVATPAENEKDDGLKALPVLGSSWGEVTAGSTSSLKAIMLEESLKIEDQKYAETQRLSLQEVQQEQEFAKWWEEESRRVQQEMMGSNGSKSKQRSNGSGPKGPRGPRKPRKDNKKKNQA